MTVIDASVVVNALIHGGGAGAQARHVLTRDALAAPSMIRAEAASGLRARLRSGDLSIGHAGPALHRLEQIKVDLFAFEPLLGRVWELRDNLSTYDAWYVALAETLDTALVTADRRLAGVPGVRCPIDVLSS